MEKIETAIEEPSDIRKKCLRPVLVALAACGCYSPKYNGSIKCKALIVYRLIILTLNLLFFVKSVAAIWVVSKKNFPGLALQILWGLTGFFNFLICFKTSSEKYGHQHKVMDQWGDDLIPKLNRLGVGYCQKRFKKKQIVILAVAATTIIVLMTFHIALIPRGTFLDVIDPDFLTAPLKPNIFTHTAVSVLFLNQLILYIIPVFYVVTLSIMIGVHFNAFNSFLRTQIHTCSYNIPTAFQELRLLHNSLCELVSSLDKDLKYLYGNAFFWNMSISLLCLNFIVKSQLDFVSLTVFIYFFVLSIGSLALISISAAFVHEEAHAPLDTIYSINVRDIDFEKMAQMNMFLSKLTGTQVGFSTCGLLVITKEFILTIVGVFLTYFAVLYTL